jgi:hypothetical protein
MASFASGGEASVGRLSSFHSVPYIMHDSGGLARQDWSVGATTENSRPFPPTINPSKRACVLVLLLFFLVADLADMVPSWELGSFGSTILTVRNPSGYNSFPALHMISRSCGRERFRMPLTVSRQSEGRTTEPTPLSNDMTPLLPRAKDLEGAACMAIPSTMEQTLQVLGRRGDQANPSRLQGMIL